jgi:hypothetical protein
MKSITVSVLGVIGTWLIAVIAKSLDDGVVITLTVQALLERGENGQDQQSRVSQASSESLANQTR